MKMKHLLLPSLILPSGFKDSIESDLLRPYGERVKENGKKSGLEVFKRCRCQGVLSIRKDRIM
ncbi:hypothetical protein [Aquiflexum lacus]|uniref:hypothetical protein n=1 Tax=Aquiflexum lacus TaxID=2483805 RepID=UPI0018960579|nr:hypothetical protein [Aquiflexum lacus]